VNKQIEIKIPSSVDRIPNEKELLDVLLKVNELIEDFFNGEDSAVLAEAQALIKEAVRC
jgi:hypothetical protein